MEHKCIFYESFAFNLTIASRLWSDPKLSDAEIVGQLKWLNEIQHKVISKIRHIRSSSDTWSESEFINMVMGYVEQNNRIRGEVALAIKDSYNFAVGDEISSKSY